MGRAGRVEVETRIQIILVKTAGFLLYTYTRKKSIVCKYFWAAENLFCFQISAAWFEEKKYERTKTDVKFS